MQKPHCIETCHAVPDFYPRDFPFFSSSLAMVLNNKLYPDSLVMAFTSLEISTTITFDNYDNLTWKFCQFLCEGMV